MVDNLEKVPPFGICQGLPDDDILELVELSLQRERHKELSIQGFDSTTQELKELVDFYECLETSKE